MRRQLVTAAAMVAIFSVLLGLAYPLAVLGVAQVAFPGQANGSIRSVDGRAVGSDLLGQAFTGERYFHPRPSAAGDGYDGLASSASNLGPSNEKLVGNCNPVPVTDADGNDVTIAGTTVNETNPDGTPVCDDSSVPQRIAAYRQANGLDAATPVPVDAVTASGSGLDPHISVANARLQGPRVATARNVPVERVQALVGRYTEGRSLGVLGEPGVNVLALNLALDRDES